MDVIVKYPDTFPLRGYQLALFDWSLRKVLRSDHFFPHKLTELAAKACVDMETDASKTLIDELNQLQYDEIEKLPSTLKAALPGKIGELLGVHIMPTRVRGGFLRKWMFAAVGVAVVPAAVAVLVISTHGSSEQQPSQVYQQHPFAPIRALPPSLPAADGVLMRAQASDSVAGRRSPEPDDAGTEGEFIVDSSVVTRTPSAQAAKAVSMATLIPGAAYRVHLTVERVAEPAVAKQD